MKRHGGLWESLVRYRNLFHAALRASRGKRALANVARFHFDLEQELCELQDELTTFSYQPGPYHEFEIFEPKRRLISAAPFRDRVIHHALCNVLEPIFERSFIHDSYACRRGKGTHAAVDRFQFFARRSRYVLQGDIRKFFPSVDHQILKDVVTRKIKDRGVLWLINRIIDHSNDQEPVWMWFPGDDLFTRSERRRGLPIGNQTSQFFANVLLNPFDHFVVEQLRPAGYLRYVDDFALFGNNKERLAEQRTRCHVFLQNLRLQLHPHKSVISRVEDGNRFLGYRVYPGYRRLPRENLLKMRRRLRQMHEEFAQGRINAIDIRRRLASWAGHARHADPGPLREALFGDTIFIRGSRADGS
jgi:RNA-directed DNA polymerase